MGLMNTWNASNRVVEQGKVITYSKKGVKGRSIWWNKGYEYHRYCSLTYRYVGMDYSTAVSCANAMIAKYTRNYTEATWDDDSYIYHNDNKGTKCMADIGIQKREGCMYEVTVAVREDDSKMNYSGAADVASLFSSENARDYDGL